MNTAFARHGEVEIAYETSGAPGGQPLLLLNGLDYQMVWADRMGLPMAMNLAAVYAEATAS